MRIHLIAVGHRMPDWVAAGYREYAERLPPDCALHLVEIAPRPRGKGADLARIRAEEGERMLAAIPAASLVIALDAAGEIWSTEALAERLAGWLAGRRDVCLLVGGPEGLAPACLARAELRWSLSRLTFPHMLVRVIVAEQVYRAWGVGRGHPYHR